MLIATHGRCPDGLAARCVLEVALSRVSPDQHLSFADIHHGQEHDVVLRWLTKQDESDSPGSMFYFDASPSPAVIAAWQAVSHRIQLIVGDHHASEATRMHAMACHPSTPPTFVLLWGHDIGVSGVTLAMQYATSVLGLPDDVMYGPTIDDIAYTDTTGVQRPVAAVAARFARTFNHMAMRSLLLGGEDAYKVAHAKGKPMLDHRVQAVNNAWDHVKPCMRTPGWYYVDADACGHLASDLAARLWDKDHSAVILLVMLKDTALAVRSRPDAHLHCQDAISSLETRFEFAKGGGHELAGGLQVRPPYNVQTILYAL